MVKNYKPKTETGFTVTQSSQDNSKIFRKKINEM